MRVLVFLLLIPVYLQSQIPDDWLVPFATVDFTNNKVVYKKIDSDANQQGQASVYSRNILLALNEIDYDEPILLPDILKSSEALEAYQDLMRTEPPKFLKVKPNPANDYIIVEYSLDKIENSAIEIVDINGKPVIKYSVYQEENQEVIDTRDWKAGIYLAIIKTNGNILESVKFTVIK